MHYDVVSNGVLWFLFHDLFDRIRRPRFDQRFREAWEAYRTVNVAFADATAEAAADGRRRARERLPARRSPAPACASSGPICASCTSRTRRSAGPTTCACSRRTRPKTSARRSRAIPAGFHTARWARAYHQSARDVLGRRAPIAPTFAASLGPDVAALDAVAVGAEAHAAARRARRRGGRPARDRAQRPHRAVEEHRARLPRLRPAARSPARAARPGRVRRDAVPVAADASRVPRVRERDRAGRRRGSTNAGRPATGRRSCSTNATTSRARSPRCSATTCCS